MVKSSPRLHNYFDPQQIRALIVTQDSFSPGLNVVIREIVQHLNYNYKVNQIYGAKYRFKGIYKEEYIKLSPEVINFVHHKGGTFLGTSRTGFNKDKIIEGLINCMSFAIEVHLFIVKQKIIFKQRKFVYRIYQNYIMKLEKENQILQFVIFQELQIMIFLFQMNLLAIIVQLKIFESAQNMLTNMLKKRTLIYSFF
ncbi:phosphofructokinase family protein, putative [Ichthyophthirius multifiliis]|uniref:Phosphofructokinase family protein, putative n=1 Tax=Ichthyophthirius multifiliis TaxID=5932 RepID=G0QWG6_ICHMU|nr:phosphofructokinase family protein, putative [Ichthyophthirius multifiliis]EGR30437.1 phosphofructokinase family protein, putative [Ichthyophthirius multifiliis]|eukprot:XP_004032024.1 phosphofructokinase family protein, putative [Ichthyophthirius multifiliis]